MKLPYLNSNSVSQSMVNSFGGYNHNDVISANEFYDMKNMSSSNYPVLSPREKRGTISSITKPNGIFSKGCLYWVDGTCFYGNDGTDGAATLRGTVSDTKKQFASMGSYLLIWPDKKYYNRLTKLFGDLEKTWAAASNASVSFSLAKWDAGTLATTDYSETITVSATSPSSPTDRMLWMDTSSTPNILKQYSASSATWVSVPTTYVKISATGIGVGFSRYDGVKISGCTNTAFNNTFVAWDAGENYITVTGIINAAFTQTGGLTVSRSVPSMDFITECDNRLWGCSSESHEIYACKLGDPFNWNCYEGISTDSYAATIGSDGNFTGAITHMGYVLFFKEDCVHKLYGSKPENFQLSSTALRGVEKGSEKSMVIVNETLYYKSRSGICTFDGSLPANISAKLGTEQYSDATAGTAGDKYYISMKNSSGVWQLFVYDEAKSIWHREDNTHALDFAALDGKLYFLNAADNKLYCTDGADESAVEWYAETGDLGDDSPDNKYTSKLQIKMAMDAETKVSVSMQFDSDGIWRKVSTFTAAKKQTFTLPIIPQRCDHFRIRISGTGGCKIYSVTKSIEDGSEF